MLLDRVIGWLSPEAGLRRARARVAMEAVASLGSPAAGQYDGAAGGRRMAGWQATGAGPNAEVLMAHPRLRDRAQDLVRNNPLAARGVAVWTSNIVGAGIIPHFIGGQAKVRRLERLAAQTLDTVQMIDANGRHDLYGLQRLAVRTMIESGEALIVRRTAPASRGLAVPLQLRVLEPDHLDTTRDGELKDGGRIIGGIELGPDGDRRAYWLTQHHPRDVGPIGTRGGLLADSQRVPAEHVIHLYETLRPGQMRGISWLAPVIVALRELHDFADAHLVRQKIAACYAVFETFADAEDAKAQSLAEPRPLEPGMQQMLAPGHDVRFGVPPQVDGYQEYIRAHQRTVAMGLGLPAEVLTGDMSQINFSAGRMSWLEFERGIDAIRWGVVIPQMCARIAEWFLAAAETVTDTGGVSISWTPPARAMISPREDMTALEKGIGLGVMSRSQAIRERGYDPDKVLVEIAQERKRMAELGIPIATDPPPAPPSGDTPPEGAPNAAEAADQQEDDDAA